MRDIEFSGDGKLLFLHLFGFPDDSIIYETENFTVAMKAEKKMDDCFCSSPSGKLMIEKMEIGRFVDLRPSNIQVFRADRSDGREDGLAGAAGIPCMVGSTEDVVISRDDKYLAANHSLGGQYLYLGRLEESPDDPDGLVCKTIADISQEPGLQVMGVDLRKLHPDSILSRENWQTLQHYGAIVPKLR